MQKKSRRVCDSREQTDLNGPPVIEDSDTVNPIMVYTVEEIVLSNSGDEKTSINEEACPCRSELSELNCMSRNEDCQTIRRVHVFKPFKPNCPTRQ